MAYFQGKVAFRQLIFGGYLVAITRILGYNTHRWMLIVYLELFTLKFSLRRFSKSMYTVIFVYLVLLIKL